MNVGDLIRELQKYPPHYTAMMVTTPAFREMAAEWSYVGEVQIETSLDRIGCVVKIIAEAS